MMYVLEYLIYHLKPYGHSTIQQCKKEEKEDKSLKKLVPQLLVTNDDTKIHKTEIEDNTIIKKEN